MNICIIGLKFLMNEYVVFENGNGNSNRLDINE